MPDSTLGTLPLQTLDATGTPPESRIANDDNGAQTVRQHVDHLAQANEDRSKTDAALFGLVSGNPPFNRELRRRNAQLSLCNVNWRIGEAMLLNALAPYHDVIANAPFYCSIRTEEGKEKQEDWSDIITQEFQRFNEKDTSLRPMFELSQFDMVLFRYGPVIWKDQFDYRATRVPQGNLLLPDRTKSDLNEWNECVLRTTMNVTDLYGLISNPKARARGWNPELAKLAITYAAPEEMWSNQNRYNWIYYAQQIRNNDMHYSAVSESVPVSFMFWREFPKDGEDQGKISVAAVVDNDFLARRQDARGKFNKELNSRGFLFRQERAYDSWQQAINPFYFNRGDGTHHSVKALGIMLYGPMVTYNKLTCKVVDGAEYASAIQFRALTDSAAQGLAVQNYGPWLVYPPGLEYLQTPNLGANLNGAMVVKEDILKTLTSNLSQYRAQVEQKSGNPVTAREIQYRMMNETVITQSTMDVYFEQLDDFWKERYRRVVNPKLTTAHAGGKLAAEFIDRCKKRGVPETALRKVEFVRATRTIGSGSAVSRAQSLERMMARFGLYTEAGRQKILEDITADDVGQALMRRYCPTTSLTPAQQDQQAIARLQIAAMMNNVPPQVTPTQDPFIFAVTFLKAAADAANSLQQGAPAAKVYSFLEVAGPAIQAHLQRLAQDPTRKDLVAQMQDQWKQLSAVHDKLGAQLQQQMRQQQQQQAQVAQQQQSMMSTEAIKAQESQSAMARKQAESDQRMSLKEQQTAQKMRLGDLSTAAKIKQQQAQAEAKQQQSTKE